MLIFSFSGFLDASFEQESLFYRFRKGTPAIVCGGKELMDNGNGALMRIFPFSMYCIMNDLGEEETLTIIRQAAGITHGHEINAMSCYLYTLFLNECLRTRNPDFAYRIRIIAKRLKALKTGAFNFTCQQNVNKALKFGCLRRYFNNSERILCLDDIIILYEGVIP